MIRKTFDIVVKELREDGGRILISTGGLDRDRDHVIPTGARTENYMKNPVVQFAHNYRDPWATIGRTTSLEIAPGGADVDGADSGIIADFELRPAANDQDPQNIIRLLWNGNWIRTASIGFRPVHAEENEEGGRDYDEWELLEWSLVPVPANQDALRMAVKALLEETDTDWRDASGPGGGQSKGTIPYRQFPLADRGAAWDGPAQIREATPEVLRLICAWYDAENPDVKQSYKLPHHLAAGGHSTVWRGVTAAMGALLGARGGTNIPDGDRRGVYNHLARHYRDFEETAPDFKEYAEEELKTLFAELYQCNDEPNTDDEPEGDVDAIVELTPEEEAALADLLGEWIGAAREALTP